jgi:hypothetical protein
MFALAVQMILSFGHMHRDDLAPSPLRTFDAAHFTSVTALEPAHPTDPDHHPTSDDYCPICVSMALVATALPALPPVLTVPVPISSVCSSQTPTYSVSTRVALSFQARAPPLA